ncbi:MAG: hypothetical protein JXD23_15480 [Spirochaetales bacterium]|nr:hypothetical protein [Spirochaetales bacterium]
MAQVYLLSVVGNILAGLVLASEHLSKKMPLFKQLDNFFKNIGMRVALALVVAVVALITLVWAYDGIPIIGDLLSWSAGLVCGFTLLYDYLRAKSDVETKALVALDKIFVENKFLIGIGAIIIALIHFFFMFVPIL